MYARFYERYYINKTYSSIFHKKINYRNPKRFSEKMQLYKTSREHLNWYIYTDKILVKEYIEEFKIRNGIKNLMNIDTYQVIDKEDILNFDFKSLNKKLPFIIKPNHYSGVYQIIKSEKDLDKINNLELQKWLKRNYYYESFETNYFFIEPKILVEKLLCNHENNHILEDLKVHCFGGKVVFFQICYGRETESGRLFYDSQWNKLEFIWSGFVDGKFTKKIDLNENRKAPNNLSEIIRICELLAVKFPYVRIDLYLEGEILYFGELTFTSGSGLDVFQPEEIDYNLGEMFNLN